MSDLATIGAYSVFIGSYIVFALGKFPGMKIDRPGAATIGAVLMFTIGAVRVNDALHFIHFGTVVLLFSMMLLVAYLHLAGFFDWITELVVTRLKPHHLLPTVIFLSGLLSAFFVNDIICLVMVPFVLKATRRMGVKPVPYLLAAATASNIGSTATITGNPQNILIGSFSGIHYRDFLWHLGPVALVGLFLDWLVLWWLHFRAGFHDVRTEIAAEPLNIEHAALVKAGLVAALVLIGFLAGFPPPLVAAVGAAIMTFVPELLRVGREIEPVITGAVLILLVIFLPGGVLSLRERLGSFSWRLANRAGSDEVPAEPGLHKGD